MLTLETTIMLANLATEPEAKRILRTGVFSMATRGDGVNAENELHSVLSMLDDV